MKSLTVSTPPRKLLQPAAVVVADDLTGACDAGMAFARRGLTTRVGFGSVPAVAAEVVAMSTNSRLMSAQAAAACVGAVAGQLPRASRMVFRKIDSTLRGNVVSECEALLESLQLPIGVLAPSLPSQGRIVREGILQVSDIAGSWSLSIPDLFRSQGAAIMLVPVLREREELRNAILAAARAGARYILCDAATEQDLSWIAEALYACPTQALWIGSAGLAAEAARRVGSGSHGTVENPLAWDAAGPPSLLCIGSDHAVSSIQMKHLCESCEIPVLQCRTAAPEEVGAGITAAGMLALRVELGDLDAECLRRQLKAALVAGVRRIALTGGDTAELICRTSAADHLLLEGEILPGVATGTIEGGLLHGLAFASKSGGFGEKDCLTRLLMAAPITGGSNRKEQL